MERKKPLISCVVAIYNVEKYLAECVESLIGQKYENVEIILVNDGSTDRSIEICEKYAEKDDRIRVITQENQGANCARNAGVAVATGEWIYFVDGDDYVTEDIFVAIEKNLESDNQIIFFSHKILKNGKIREIHYPLDEIVFKASGDKNDFYELRLAALNRFGDSCYNYKILDAVSIWNKCYRKDFLIQNKLEFIPRFPKCQDMAFNLMVYKVAEKGIFINHPGYVYRINADSVTNRYQADFIEKLDVMCKWFEEYIDTYKDDGRMLEAYRGRILTFLRTSIVLYFCNNHNLKSYKERKREFIVLLKEQQYALKVKCAKLQGLPVQEKVLSWCIKNVFFEGCELLSLLHSMVRR